MISLSLSYRRRRQRKEEEGWEREEREERYPSKRRSREGMSQRLIKSGGPEASRWERGKKRGVSRAWEKASRFIDCQGPRAATGAALLLHPHCSINRGTDAWATVVLRGESLFPHISPTFWPIKRDISSPPISPNVVETVASAIRVDSTNCRHALPCILVGSRAPLLGRWTKLK